MQEFTPSQNKILNTALAIIGGRGVNALTTKRLAAALSISEPALYRHFANKGEFLSALLDRLKTSVISLLHKLDAKKDSSFDKIQFFYREYFGMLSRSPGLATALFAEEHFQENEHLCAKMLEMFDVLQAAIDSLVAKGRASGELRNDLSSGEMAFIIVGTMRLVITQWRLKRCRLNLTRQGMTALKALRKCCCNEPAI